MASGPENFKAAQKFADLADQTGEEWMVTLSKAHALLALVALTVEVHRNDLPEDEYIDWVKAIHDE